MSCPRTPYPATLPRPTASVGCTRRAWPEPCTPVPGRPACAHLSLRFRRTTGPAPTTGPATTFAGPPVDGPDLDLAGPAGTTGSIIPPAGPAEATTGAAHAAGAAITSAARVDANDGAARNAGAARVDANVGAGRNAGAARVAADAADAADHADNAGHDAGAAVGGGAVATCVRPGGDGRPALGSASPVPGEALDRPDGPDRPDSAAPTTRRLPAVAVEGPDSACLPSSSNRGDIPASAERPGARR